MRRPTAKQNAAWQTRLQNRRTKYREDTGIMEYNDVQFVGPPSLKRGNCTCYKGFKYKKGDQWKILSFGDHFFVKISPDSPICVGELQLIWHNNSEDIALCEVRLYFLPENTPDGRKGIHGEDELLVAKDKVPLTISDLLNWIQEGTVEELGWKAGRTPWAKHTTVVEVKKEKKELNGEQEAKKDDDTKNGEEAKKGEDGNKGEEEKKDEENDTKNTPCIQKQYLDSQSTEANQKMKKLHTQILHSRFNYTFMGLKMDEVIAEQVELGPSAANTCPILLATYPQYCRIRAIMKRLEGVQHMWNHNILVTALTGIPQLTARTKVMYIRHDHAFESEDLQDHALRVDYLMPSLKGKRRGRKRKLEFTVKEQPTGAAAVADTEDSNSGESVDSFTGRGKRMLNGKAEAGGGDGENVENKRMKMEFDTMEPNKSPFKDRLNGHSFTMQPSTSKAAEDEASFLKRLYQFNQENKTPILKVPTLGFKEVDLYNFYHFAKRLGGYNQISSTRSWKKLYDSLGGNQTNTSAATCTRKHYEKILLAFERHENGQPAKPAPSQYMRPPKKSDNHHSQQGTSGTASDGLSSQQRKMALEDAKWEANKRLQPGSKAHKSNMLEKERQWEERRRASAMGKDKMQRAHPSRPVGIPPAAPAGVYPPLQQISSSGGASAFSAIHPPHPPPPPPPGHGILPPLPPAHQAQHTIKLPQGLGILPIPGLPGGLPGISSNGDLTPPPAHRHPKFKALKHYQLPGPNSYRSPQSQEPRPSVIQHTKNGAGVHCKKPSFFNPAPMKCTGQIYGPIMDDVRAGSKRSISTRDQELRPPPPPAHSDWKKAKLSNEKKKESNMMDNIMCAHQRAQENSTAQKTQSHQPQQQQQQQNTQTQRQKSSLDLSHSQSPTRPSPSSSSSSAAHHHHSSSGHHRSSSAAAPSTSNHQTNMSSNRPRAAHQAGPILLPPPPPLHRPLAVSPMGHSPRSTPGHSTPGHSGGNSSGRQSESPRRGTPQAQTSSPLPATTLNPDHQQLAALMAMAQNQAYLPPSFFMAQSMTPGMFPHGVLPHGALPGFNPLMFHHPSLATSLATATTAAAASSSPSHTSSAPSSMALASALASLPVPQGFMHPGQFQGIPVSSIYGFPMATGGPFDSTPPSTSTSAAPSSKR